MSMNSSSGVASVARAMSISNPVCGKSAMSDGLPPSTRVGRTVSNSALAS
jgi:hypothetical protein